MTAAQIINIFCWGIFLLYWFINWSNVKPTKEQIGFSTQKIRFIIGGIIVLLLINHFILHNAFHFHTFSLASGPLLVQLTSILLAILGISVAVVARRTLADNWSATLDLKKGHELVTRGIYHYIRHPIYTGLLTMLAATLLAFPSATELIIVFVVFVTFLVRIKKEEELMTRVFPKEYSKYKTRTKALIPFIW